MSVNKKGVSNKKGWHKVHEESYAHAQRARKPKRAGFQTVPTPKPCPKCFAPLHPTDEKGVFVCSGSFEQHTVRV